VLVPVLLYYTGRHRRSAHHLPLCVWADVTMWICMHSMNRNLQRLDGTACVEVAFDSVGVGSVTHGLTTIAA